MREIKKYNLTPARGQALLNFQGRLYPDKVELYETNLIEEIKQKKETKLFYEKKQTDINADFRNLLIQGDCLSACAYLKEKNIKVDLVYIDPPFASGANYAKKIYLRNGGKSSIENDDNSIGEEIMYGDIWQKEDYLNWLYERLLTIRDVMSETGSIYVHLDWHIGHYAKLLLDEVFGEENFVNEIIWKKTNSPKSQTKEFGKQHDTIFVYSKTNEFILNSVYKIPDENYLKSFSNNDNDGKGAYQTVALIAGGIQRSENRKVFEFKGVNAPWLYSLENLNKFWNDGRIVGTKGKLYRLKVYLSDMNGPLVSDLWVDKEVAPLQGQADEKTEYSTQKPEKLLERIMVASSNKDMIVADFFSGSGVLSKVANDFDRKFIACDIGINAIQTTRDRLIEAKANFDILKIHDGVRLFRNPAQTTAKLFSLIDGFKNKTDLNLGNFWDGGIINNEGAYTPLKFIGLHEKLTKELVDVILEEVYQLEDTENKKGEVKLIYAHKNLDIDQNYINKEIKNSGKTTLKVELISLDELLGQKADMLFMPDNADISIKKEKDKFKVEIKKYYSSYMKSKIDEYNVKKVKREDNELKKQNKNFTPIKISNNGLELIESIQFDTTLRKDGVWTSNLDLEDKAGIKDKIKGVYYLQTDKFKIKIRNIAGDETVIDSNDIDKK